MISSACRAGSGCSRLSHKDFDSNTSLIKSETRRDSAKYGRSASTFSSSAEGDTWLGVPMASGSRAGTDPSSAVVDEVPSASLLSVAAMEALVSVGVKKLRRGEGRRGAEDPGMSLYDR